MVKWKLFADPRIPLDRVLIELFNSSTLIGSVIPTGASAGEPELVCEEGGVRIRGNEKIRNFLESLHKE